MNKDNNSPLNRLNVNNTESVEKTYELYTSERLNVKKEEPSFNNAFQNFKDSIQKAKDSITNTEVSIKSFKPDLQESLKKLQDDIHKNKIDQLKSYISQKNGNINSMIKTDSKLQTREQKEEFLEKINNLKVNADVENVNTTVVASLINKINK
jgi:phage-related protein